VSILKALMPRLRQRLQQPRPLVKRERKCKPNRSIQRFSLTLSLS
jgi:hypothetical protein